MASHEIDLSAAQWRKSSYSNGTGGECVEVAGDFPGAALWRTSSYSNATGGDCVEVATGLPGVIPVRDSKFDNGPVLLIAPTPWSAFLASLRK
ncbi:DUF397 domain-containing protein [Streptomyces sp. NPDC050704]|uniref:DUF397 domain-containing protein n=1 Tax=Streptomyces sp. NPDC050704 TaxID=3157219 RepID=UPI0034123AEB